MKILNYICIIYIFIGCSESSSQQMLGTDIRLFKNTPLWDLAKAVESENISEIEILVKEKKTSINYQEPTYGQTLLMWAVLTEKYKSAEELLKLGASPNLRSSYNNASNALIVAADNFENTNFLKLLLKYGGNPNANDLPLNARKEFMTTPLITACGNANLENVKLLVEAGTDINFKTPSGNTALKTAASMNHVYIVKYLLIEKKAEFNYLFSKSKNGDEFYLVDYMREWPFDIGSDKWKCKMEIVNFLKEHGMDYKKTPIPKQIHEQYSKEFIENY